MFGFIDNFTSRYNAQPYLLQNKYLRHREICTSLTLNQNTYFKLNSQGNWRALHDKDNCTRYKRALGGLILTKRMKSIREFIYLHISKLDIQLQE